MKLFTKNSAKLLLIAFISVNLMSFFFSTNVGAVFYTRDEIRSKITGSPDEEYVNYLFDQQKTWDQMRAEMGGVPDSVVTERFDAQDVLGFLEDNANANNDSNCSGRFLGFPAWYRGLVDGECNVMSPEDAGLSMGDYIGRIVMNVIDAIAILIIYASVGFIIYGGFLYLTSQGSSDGVNKAKTTITNAVIGLILAIIATSVINFIFSRIGLK